MEQITTPKSILSGISFLVAEAERNGFHEIALILKCCEKYIGEIIENASEFEGNA